MPSHRQLANWYAQLAHQLDAGIPLADCLRLSGGPGSRDREAMARAVEAGQSVPDILRDAPAWLPKADRVFIAAGLETGHLPQTFSRLAERRDRIRANLRKVVFGLIYPLGVFHVAALILPLVRMIDFERGFGWELSGHLLGTAALLVPLWALIGLFILMAKIESPVLPRILRALPFLRAYRRAQSLADLAHALSLFVAAGIPVPQAWRAARRLLNDPPVERAIQALEPEFAAGRDPAARLAEQPCFPSDFVAFYRNGARSGKLDEMLARFAAQSQTRANQSMTFAAILYPGLILVAVGLFLIYNIFIIYGGYLQSFESLL